MIIEKRPGRPQLEAVLDEPVAEIGRVLIEDPAWAAVEPGPALRLPGRQGAGGFEGEIDAADPGMAEQEFVPQVAALVPETQDARPVAGTPGGIKAELPVAVEEIVGAFQRLIGSEDARLQAQFPCRRRELVSRRLPEDRDRPTEGDRGGGAEQVV